jgi:hypothetical protein
MVAKLRCAPYLYANNTRQNMVNYFTALISQLPKQDNYLDQFFLCCLTPRLPRQIEPHSQVPDSWEHFQEGKAQCIKALCFITKLNNIIYIKQLN